MIKRYTASEDTTITNAYKPDLVVRGTGSNMGEADVLEVFHIYAQAATGSSELSRVLVRFPIGDISTDRTATTIPASGSVSFYLRLFNAKHSQTLPRNFTLQVSAISTQWEEGSGLDMEEYSDLTHDATGANWINARGNTQWTTAGGDYSIDGEEVFTTTFDRGYEDMELDITSLVEKWMASDVTNYGVGVAFTSAIENNASSSYTKKFFSRSSEYFFKRPIIEARWDSTRRDQRNNFYYSSSLAPAADNLNTLYLYNYVRGRLQNIPTPGTGNIFVDLYAGDTSTPIDILRLSSGGDVPNLGTPATGGWVATGVYSASLAITAAAAPYSRLYDVWYDDTATYHTGTIVPKSLTAGAANPYPRYITNITNLRTAYSTHESATRFRLYVREKDWNPTIYTVASTAIENITIEDAYYKVFRIVDDLEIIKFATGSATTPQTVGNTESYSRMSYDVSGNYFDFDVGMLQSGYSYGVKFAYYVNSAWQEQPEIFKFRVG
tara:strand:- start:14675 stop:16159 length:1485 start_codon:yes stop_codon:yes gene_type:complete